MNLAEQFKQHLHNNFSEVHLKYNKWLLAVSGGVDSIVLCHLVHNAGVDFTIAHCNFQLRGEESQRDEEFVKTLGFTYGKQVLVQRFDTAAYAQQYKKSIQVAARELRYQWFHQIINGQWQVVNGVGQMFYPEGNSVVSNEGSRPLLIVTAHHANDHIETLLMNFFKGTGITGLHGIVPLHYQLFRPLLPFKKEVLLAYARDNNLPFVEDSSNQTDKYTRNFLRHQLMPLLTELYPQVEDNLLKNIDRFAEAGQLYRQAVEQQLKKLLEYKGNEVHIPVLKLKKAVPLRTIVFEILQPYGFTAAQTEEVLSLLDSGSGKYVTSATHRVLKNRQWLIITTLQNSEAQNIVINETDSEVLFAQGSLTIAQQPFDALAAIPTSRDIAWIDARRLTYPLLLRRWKQGDYFYPLGMAKKKKLSRFFIDQKLSLAQKEKVWVLEADKKIVWIVGYRIDDRCKVGPATKNVVAITFTKE